MKLRQLVTAFSLLLAVLGPLDTFAHASYDSVPVPPEIEDPRCLGINKQPYHATLMPYASLQEALKLDRHASTYCQSLNGAWKFNWVSWPQQRPADFYKPSYDVSK